MAVSMNKLGDRAYFEKDLHSAIHHYREALSIRQASCNGLEPISAEVQLGIVTSLLKVADIEQVRVCRPRCTGFVCYMFVASVKSLTKGSMCFLKGNI